MTTRQFRFDAGAGIMAGILLAMCFISLMIGTASAQTFGEIAGVVKDASESVMPAASAGPTSTL